MYPVLAPWAGMFATGGAGSAIGPVDAFLALAAAAVGEVALAARHADDALRVCRAEGLDPVAEWLTGLRTRHGF